MLTDKDKELVGKRTLIQTEQMEQELINEAARAIVGQEGVDSYVTATNLGNVSRKANAILAKYRPLIILAVGNDVRAELELNAEREADVARKAGAAIERSVLASSVSAAFNSHYAEALGYVSNALNGVPSGLMRDYVNACARAAVQVRYLGTREAMRNAVSTLARAGVTCNTYTTSRGTSVSVPVDVGIRRAMQNAGQRARMGQTLAIADMSGEDLVEVNVTANARVSHAEWQGQIYSLSGKSKQYKPFQTSCNVGDPVDGIGGYNCGHEVAIYYPGMARTFVDPLKGTGYSTEQARELTTRQRALEREIRASKREAQALKASGFDAREANAKQRAAQSELRALISEHEILHRDRTREQLYG